MYNQQDQPLRVLAQTVGNGGNWLEDATAVALPGGQVVIPGLLLFGVEAPPPPPPPLTAEQRLEIQEAREKESEEKFQSMISEPQKSVDTNKEFADHMAQQMTNFDQRLLQLGKVAGKKVMEMENQFSQQVSQTHEAIVKTQQCVIELGNSQETREEREKR